MAQKVFYHFNFLLSQPNLKGMYDVDKFGNSLEVAWVGACCKTGSCQEDRKEALMQMSIDAKKEEMLNINRINRKRVAEQNKAPF